MKDKLLDYIREGTSATEKWQRLLNLSYSGYLTGDVLEEFIVALSSEDSEFADPAINKPIETYPELMQVVDGQAFPPRRITLDLDTVLRYKPESIDSAWINKENLDNCFGVRTPNNPDIMSIAILEEHGFIKINNVLVSRTIQPVFIPYAGMVNNTVAVLPAAYEEDFLGKFPTISAIGGGFSYYGIFEMRRPSEYLRSLGCAADTVLRCVGRPRQYQAPYPYDLVNYEPCVGIESVYENVGSSG